MTVSELLTQILPLAATPLAAFIPDSIVRDVVLVFAFIYFGAFVVRPNLPDIRMKQLGEYIQDITKIHSIAVQELEHSPHFTTELGLRMREIKFSESVLRSKTLSVKDVKWKDYPQYLKCLWCNIEECQRQVRDIRTSMLLEIEANHQRKYTMDILQRRAALETMFPVENRLYGTESYTLEAESESAEYTPRPRNHGALWNGRYGSAASARPNIGQSRVSAV